MKEKDFNEVSRLLADRRELTELLMGIEGAKTRLVRLVGEKYLSPSSMHLFPLKVRSGPLRTFYDLEIKEINRQLKYLGLELDK